MTPCRAGAVGHARRHVAARKTVAQVFLPRVPTDLIAATSVAFMDGLVMDHAYGERGARVAFDVFWLAKLSLG